MYLKSSPEEQLVIQLVCKVGQKKEKVYLKEKKKITKVKPS